MNKVYLHRQNPLKYSFEKDLVVELFPSYVLKLHEINSFRKIQAVYRLSACCHFGIVCMKIAAIGRLHCTPIDAHRSNRIICLRKQTRYFNSR